LKQRTAILLFSRSAKEEIAHKQFSFTSLRQSKNIAAKLIQQTSRIAQSSGLPVLHADQQQGANFAERLAYSIQKAFQNGYEQVIAIGNDTPALNVAHLRQAEQALSQKDVVLGPSEDGGIYLLGLKKEAFKQLSFEQLSWQTAHLFTELVYLISRQKWSFHTLETLADIDNAKDFLDFIHKSLFYFAQILKSLLFTTSIFPVHHIIPPTPITQFPFHQRPPPIHF
jgi:glycosyltransferase A (GT-A) superfamily protein (DUF2064 family)